MDNRIFERLIIFLAVVLIGSAAAGIWYLATHDLGKGFISGEESIGNIDTVENSNGVKRKLRGSFNWSPVEKNEPVFYKDAIFVGEKSEITLKLNDSTKLRIGENSLLVLDDKIAKDTATSVTEVRLIRGKISVDKPSEPTAADDKKSKDVEIVLDSKVKINVGKSSSVALSKTSDKANILLGKGNVTMSVEGKTKERKQISASGKPTLLKSLDLKSEEKLLENVKAQESEKKDTVAMESADFFKTLPEDPKAESSVLSSGDIAAIQSEIPDISLDNLKKSLETVKAEPTSTATPTPEPTIEPTPEPTPSPQIVVTPKKKKKPVIIPDAVITLQAPVPDLEFDYTKNMTQITFQWEAQFLVADHFNLQLSSSETFEDVITTIQIRGKRTSQMKTRFSRPQPYEATVSPVYLLYVPEILKIIYQNKPLWWRVVPADSDNDPVMSSEKIPKQSIRFLRSQKAQIRVEPASYKAESAKSGALPIQLGWTLNDVVPGHYKVVFSPQANFGEVVCEKKITRFSFESGLQDRDRVPTIARILLYNLAFNEDITIKPDSECPLGPIMANGSELWFKILTYDPAGNAIEYTNPELARGKAVPK